MARLTALSCCRCVVACSAAQMSRSRLAAMSRALSRRGLAALLMALSYLQVAATPELACPGRAGLNAGGWVCCCPRHDHSIALTMPQLGHSVWVRVERGGVLSVVHKVRLCISGLGPSWWRPPNVPVYVCMCAASMHYISRVEWLSSNAECLSCCLAVGLQGSRWAL